ncbi:hypothetical protein EDD16DRAFT_1557494, partial [Pisolithus croceorrhizus]
MRSPGPGAACRRSLVQGWQECRGKETRATKPLTTLPGSILVISTYSSPEVTTAPRYFFLFEIEDYKTSSRDHLPYCPGDLLDGIVGEHTRRGVPLHVRDRSFLVMELYVTRRTWSSRGCDFRKQCGASKVRKQSRSRNHPPYTFRSKFCRGWYDRVERRPFRESQQIETDAFDARRDCLGVIFVGLQTNILRCADHHSVPFFLFNGMGDLSTIPL